MDLYRKFKVKKRTAQPGDLLTAANQMKQPGSPLPLTMRKSKKRTVKVTYQPGSYKESEEVKAINALHEMHKGKRKSKKRKSIKKRSIHSDIPDSAKAYKVKVKFRGKKKALGLA